MPSSISMKCAHLACNLVEPLDDNLLFDLQRQWRPDCRAVFRCRSQVKLCDGLSSEFLMGGPQRVQSMCFIQRWWNNLPTGHVFADWFNCACRQCHDCVQHWVRENRNMSYLQLSHSPQIAVLVEDCCNWDTEQSCEKSVLPTPLSPVIINRRARPANMPRICATIASWPTSSEDLGRKRCFNDSKLSSLFFFLSRIWIRIRACFVLLFVHKVFRCSAIIKTAVWRIYSLNLGPVELVSWPSPDFSSASVSTCVSASRSVTRHPSTWL